VHSSRSRAGSRAGATVVGPLVFLFILAIAWDLSTRFGMAPAWLLPTPQRVGVALGRLLGDAGFRSAVFTTLFTSVAAFALAAPVALSFGILLGQWFHRAARVNAAVNVLLSTPQSVFLPLFVLFFGIGHLQKLVFGFTHALFVIIVVTAAAVRSIDPRLIRAARAFGARDGQLVVQIYLPSMLPLVMTGLRIGFIFAVSGVITAEMYASRTGIGQLLFLWTDLGAMDNLFAAIVLVTVVMIVINESLRRLERRSWEVQSSAWRV